ncbi:MAG: pyridoxal 5'-phosphate synthase glutaminase subunit PdxT [Clostridia bacterium]|jgi:5'-phosphate synthase pdxT subunit
MIGVLALQGGFIEHIKALSKLGAESFEIRQLSDLEGKKINGLILPGGESTVVGKLLRELELLEPLKKLIGSGTPVFGSCAGMILLAKQISNDPHVYFDAMDISVKRNAFGRQLGSFFATADFNGIGEVPMIFIRAPYIETAADDVEILAQVKGHIVAARQGNMLATAFHPELSDDLRIHEYFLKLCK